MRRDTLQLLTVLTRLGLSVLCADRCEHCKRLAPTFAISATYFRSAVRHVEVQCSGAHEETDFCKRHGVQSYPVVMLFNGEQAVRYEGEERSVRAFDAFFEEHVAGYESPVKAARKVARKKRAKGTEEEVEDAAASFVEAADERVVSAHVGKVEAAVKAEKKQRRGVEKTAMVAAPTASVAERLGTLEKEVSEMHDTLRAIQQQLTALVAQRR